MTSGNHEELRSILKGMIAQHGLGDPYVDALLEYTMSRSNDNPQEAEARLSYMLGSNVNGAMQMQTVTQVELLKNTNQEIYRKLNDLERQFDELARSQPKTDLKWQVVQGVFSVISFVASTVAFLKAFGLITLNIP